MKSIFAPVFYLVLICGLVACSGNDTGSDEDSQEDLMEQRITHLENADKYGALPTYEGLEVYSEQFKSATDALNSDPNQQNLETAREQWKELAAALKKCELYDIGDVKDSYLHYRIHRWPTNIELLEDTLSGRATIDAVYADRLGSQIIGLGALEYLLFKDDLATTIELYDSEPRRLAYLWEITQLQHELVKKVVQRWKDYGPEFIVATQSRISGGQNQLTNSLLSFLEQTARLRLGNPAGESSGQAPDVSRLEAPFSDYSLEMIASGFEEWKRCFYGNFPESSNEYGFDDYLATLNAQDLVDRIETSIKACDAELVKTQSLNKELVENTQQVLALQERFNELASLIKADLASVTGATITVNDSDGDS